MLPLLRRYFESNAGAADLLGLFDHLLKSVEISDDGPPEGIFADDSQIHNRRNL